MRVKLPFRKFPFLFLESSFFIQYLDRLYLFCLNLSKADENSLKGGSSSFTFCFFNIFSYSFFFSLSTLAFSWSWIKKAKQVRVKNFNIFNKPDQLIQIYQREVLLSCFKKYMISKRYNNMPLTTKWELIRRIFIGHWKSWHFGKIRNTKIAVLKLKGRDRLLRSSLSILSNLRFSKSFFLPLPNTYSICQICCICCEKKTYVTFDIFFNILDVI